MSTRVCLGPVSHTEQEHGEFRALLSETLYSREGKLNSRMKSVCLFSPLPCSERPLTPWDTEESMCADKNVASALMDFEQTDLIANHGMPLTRYEH